MAARYMGSDSQVIRAGVASIISAALLRRQAIWHACS